MLFLRSGRKAPKLSLFEFDVASGKRRNCTAREAAQGGEEKLTPEEKARRERQHITTGRFAGYLLDEAGKSSSLALSGRLFLFDRTSEVARNCRPEGGSSIRSGAGGKHHGLRPRPRRYTSSISRWKESAITKGGTRSNARAGRVRRPGRDGRYSGYWWITRSQHIAYQEADHTGVETWYVADPIKPDEKPPEQFYPRPGKKNVAVPLASSRWVARRCGWNGTARSMSIWRR